MLFICLNPSTRARLFENSSIRLAGWLLYVPNPLTICLQTTVGCLCCANWSIRGEVNKRHIEEDSILTVYFSISKKMNDNSWFFFRNLYALVFVVNSLAFLFERLAVGAVLSESESERLGWDENICSVLGDILSGKISQIWFNITNVILVLKQSVQIVSFVHNHSHTSASRPGSA